MGVIDVAVFQGDQFLRWARNRPVRNLPIGIVGAVVGGLAYPVYEKKFDSLSINLDDTSFDSDTDNCPFWPKGEPLVFADTSKQNAILDWYMESNIFGHYLVFDGDEYLLNDVLSRLTRNGIEIRRYGASHRPADNGYHYDWFVRLGLEGSREEAEDSIRSALMDGEPKAETSNPASLEILMLLPQAILADVFSAGHFGQDIPALLGWLGEQLEDTRLEVDEVRSQLQGELDDANNLFSNLRQEYTSFRSSATKAKKQTQHAADTFKAETQALRDHLAKEPSNSREIAELKQQHAIFQQEIAARDNLIHEAGSYENKIEALKNDLAQCRVEAMDRGKKLERRPQPVKAGRGHERIIKLVQEVLTKFHRLEFYPDASQAAEVVAHSFPDHTSLFSVLEKLHLKEKLRFTSVKGKNGWLEVTKHINTGNPSQAGMGRVYYQPIKNDKLCVSLHCKQDDNEQERHFKKLGDPDSTRELSYG